MITVKNFKKLMVSGGLVILCFIIIPMVLFMGLTQCLNNDMNKSLSKNEIFDLVNKNYLIILNDIAIQDFQETSKLEGILDIYTQNGVLDFYCGGKGFGDSTSYCGFYYSENDLPIGVWCGAKTHETDELITDGNGYTYREPEGDNRYYTERIREKFYYYEAHF